MEENVTLKNKVIELLSVCYGNSDSDTKAEFAEKLGTNYLQLYRWMTGKTIPRKRALQKICKTCGVEYYNVLDIESTIVEPFSQTSIDSVVESYEHLVETKSNRPKLNLIISASSLLVQNAFMSVGLDTTLKLTRRSDPVDSVVTEINFIEPSIIDLNLIIMGQQKSINYVLYGANNDKALAADKLTAKSVLSLASLIKKNYLKT